MIYYINKGCTVNDFCNIENSRLHGVTKNKHKFSQIMTTLLNQTNEIRHIVIRMQYTKKSQNFQICFPKFQKLYRI